MELRGLPTGRNIIEKIGYVQVFSALVIRWFVDKLQTSVLHTASEICMPIQFSDWRNVIFFSIFAIANVNRKKQIK